MKTIKLSRKGNLEDINKEKNQNEKFKHLISSKNFNDTRDTKNGHL